MTYSIDLNANREMYEGLKIGFCDVYFRYNGYNCGIEVETDFGSKVYTAWCGEEIREYTDSDSALNDRFYSGKSIADLVEIVQFSPS